MNARRRERVTAALASAFCSGVSPTAPSRSLTLTSASGRSVVPSTFPCTYKAPLIGGARSLTLPLGPGASSTRFPAGPTPPPPVVGAPAGEERARLSSSGAGNSTSEKVAFCSGPSSLPLMRRLASPLSACSRDSTRPVSESKLPLAASSCSVCAPHCQPAPRRSKTAVCVASSMPSLVPLASTRPCQRPRRSRSPGRDPPLPPESPAASSLAGAVGASLERLPCLAPPPLAAPAPSPAAPAVLSLPASSPAAISNCCVSSSATTPRPLTPSTKASFVRPTAAPKSSSPRVDCESSCAAGRASAISATGTFSSHAHRALSPTLGAVAAAAAAAAATAPVDSRVFTGEEAAAAAALARRSSVGTSYCPRSS